MAATEPTVSVIIPVCNRADTIGRAVDSVFAQRFDDYELLVVDDGSTDGTVEVCESKGDPRLRVLRHLENRGAAAARNTGIRVARGTYLAFLDSDDAWSSDKLALQTMFLRSQGTTCRVCCTGYALVQDGVSRDYIPPPVDRRRLLLGCDLSPGSTLMAQREVFNRVGPFDESLPRYEDWDWLLRCQRHFEIGVLPQPLAVIHYSPRRSAAAVEASAWAFLEHYEAELDALGMLGRKARGLRWLEVARYYALERRPVPSARYLARAYATYPFYGPGSALLLIDAWLGTHLEALALDLRDQLRRIARRGGPA